MKFWKQTKTYHSDLRAEEINIIVSKGLTTKQILFLNPINLGIATVDKFSYTAFRPGRIFPIKVKATLKQEAETTILIVEYKTNINPILILILVWTFFILCASVDKFTINGEQVSSLKQMLFCGTGLIFVSLFIFFAAISPITSEKLKLETELKLKRPDVPA